jgi:hypothetical protein
MELAVLDRIEMMIDVDGLAAELCLGRAGTAAAAPLRPLLAEALALARPRVAYRLSTCEPETGIAVLIDGVALRSRILAVHLEGAHRAFPFVATCGRELAAWSALKRDPLERFWAQAIMARALATAVEALGRELRQRFGLQETGILSPGSLGDWPIEDQVPLFRVLGDVEGALGVRLTEGLMMDPVHSLSGMVFPTTTDFDQCRLCPREPCPARRTAFEDNLYETRYGRRDTNPSD